MWPCPVTHGHLQKNTHGHTAKSKPHWVTCGNSGCILAKWCFSPLWIWNAWHSVGPEIVWRKPNAFKLYNTNGKYELIHQPCRRTLTMHRYISAFLKPEHMKCHTGPLCAWVFAGAAMQKPWLFRIVCLFSQSLNVSEETPNCGRLTV